MVPVERLNGLVEDFRIGIENALTNFPQLYDSTWPLVDALIFTLIFVGLARVVFEKRFPGSGGKGLIIGVGIALSVAMVWAEIQYHLSLKSLGPYALGLVAILLSFMVFQTGRALGLGKIASASLVVFLGLPIVSQVLPGLTQLFAEALPLVIMIWLASGAATGVGTWRLGHESLRHFREGRLVPVEGADGEVRELKSLDKREKHDVKRAYRQSEKAIGTLKKIRSDLERYGVSEEGRERISGDLHRLNKEEHEIVQDLQDLQSVINRIWNVDRALYGQIRVALKHSTGGQRDAERKAEGDAGRELTLQQALNALRGRFGQYDQAFKQAVNQAILEIRRARAEEAIRWVNHALHWELKASMILKDLRSAQKEAHRALRRLRGEVAEVA